MAKNTTYLTVYSKEQIRDKVIAHKFNPIKAELAKREDAIATAIYDRLYSSADKGFMKSGPTDAFRLNNSVCMKWATRYHRFTLLTDLQFFGQRTEVITVEAVDPLAELADSWFRDKNAYDSARQDARKQVFAALESYRSFEKLLSDWPEISKFVLEVMPTAARSVPVVTHANLNKILDLPPEKIAA